MDSSNYWTPSKKLCLLNLLSLSINDNNFCDIASKFLYRESKLITLILNNNFITSIGIKNTAGILSYNQTLRHLYLWNNCLTSSRSISCILDILQSNVHICTFEIENDIYQERNIHHIKELLDRNCNKHLYCKAARELITNDEMTTIQSALWPHILTGLECPDDMYDIVSLLVLSCVPTNTTQKTG